MQFRYLAALLVLAYSIAASGDTVPSAEFWQWYQHYADENGDVFDPLALDELSNLDLDANLENEDTNTEQNRGTDKQMARQQESNKSTREQ